MKDGHLEAKDLMIGDWVLFKGHLFCVNFPMLESINCGAEVEPIPLTPEILKKNGWEFDNYDGKWENPNAININCVNYCDNLSIFGNNAPFYDDGLPINYVHELQHALHLCGLKELLYSFKV